LSIIREFKKQYELISKKKLVKALPAVRIIKVMWCGKVLFIGKFCATKKL
jgi:hypothetical protein